MRPGEVIASRYELIRPLGDGGLGFVWVARQLGVNREVALKVLKSARSTRGRTLSGSAPGTAPEPPGLE